MANWLPLAIILLLIQNIICFTRLDIVHTHCTQTAKHSLYSTPRIVIPEQTEASEVWKPVLEFGHMTLDLCPDRRFLKLSWTINQTQNYETKLCYQIRSIPNADVDTVCFSLRLHQSNYAVAVDCWFPMEFINYKPVITAWTVSTNKTTPKFYGSLDTSALDPENTCKDMCEVVAMNIGSQINCQDKASIMYDTSTVVKFLSFDAIDKTACENGISTFQRFNNHLEYQLNCSFAGTGYIKVLYSTHGKYCLKYQMVRVICPNASRMALASKADDTHSFGTFLIFGVVCIAIIASVFFATVFVVQWLYDKIYCIKSQHRRHSGTQHRRYSDQQRHRFSDSGPNHVSIKREECYQLDTFRPLPSGSRQAGAVVNADVSQSNKTSPRQRSASASSDKMPEEENERQRLLVLPMRRSITMALLEETDPFYKKRILFLPIPFDHYTNDVVKILKSVFMDEGGIPSKCCFDRKIYQEYMESDRFKWIENIFGDHDKILVFLCFTSLSTGRTAKRESMAEVILENLLFTKVKSHRFCKVILLHLTDSPDTVQKHHIGDSFHINNPNAYEDFIKNVLSFCGRTPEENPVLINRLSNCKSSRHFLEFIGIKLTS